MSTSNFDEQPFFRDDEQAPEGISIRDASQTRRADRER
jgi:hypothetical protein